MKTITPTTPSPPPTGSAPPRRRPPPPPRTSITSAVDPPRFHFIVLAGTPMGPAQVSAVRLPRPSAPASSAAALGPGAAARSGLRGTRRGLDRALHGGVPRLARGRPAARGGLGGLDGVVDLAAGRPAARRRLPRGLRRGLLGGRAAPRRRPSSAGSSSRLLRGRAAPGGRFRGRLVLRLLGGRAAPGGRLRAVRLRSRRAGFRGFVGLLRGLAAGRRRRAGRGRLDGRGRREQRRGGILAVTGLRR